MCFLLKVTFIWEAIILLVIFFSLEKANSNSHQPWSLFLTLASIMSHSFLEAEERLCKAHNKCQILSALTRNFNYFYIYMCFVRTDNHFKASYVFLWLYNCFHLKCISKIQKLEHQPCVEVAISISIPLEKKKTPSERKKNPLLNKYFLVGEAGHLQKGIHTNKQWETWKKVSFWSWYTAYNKTRFSTPRAQQNATADRQQTEITPLLFLPSCASSCYLKIAAWKNCPVFDRKRFFPQVYSEWRCNWRTQGLPWHV